MKITKDSTQVVDVVTSIQILSQHKVAILKDNGWLWDDYDERYTNQANGCMMSAESMDKAFAKYISKIQSSGYTSVDIFKILYILLHEIRNGVVMWDGDDGDSW
jgi:hypothetical protein